MYSLIKRKHYPKVIKKILKENPNSVEISEKGFLITADIVRFKKHVYIKVNGVYFRLTTKRFDKDPTFYYRLAVKQYKKFSPILIGLKNETIDLPENMEKYIILKEILDLEVETSMADDLLKKIKLKEI